MSAVWRAVATWITRVFRRRHDDWVRPWNGVTMRALYEDVRLPFEVGTAPVVTVTAQPAETAIPASARTMAPTGTEDAVASAEPASAEAPSESRRVA